MLNVDIKMYIFVIAEFMSHITKRIINEYM